MEQASWVILVICYSALTLTFMFYWTYCLWPGALLAWFLLQPVWLFAICVNFPTFLCPVCYFLTCKSPNTISVRCYLLTCRPGAIPLCNSCVLNSGIVLYWYGITYFDMCCIYSFLLLFVLWQILSFFQSVLQRVWCSASCFKFRYPFISLVSIVAAYIFFLVFPPLLPSLFPSVTCFRRQFLHKMWPIQLAFLLFTVCSIFLPSFTLCNISSFLTRSVHLIFPILLQHHISKLFRYFWSTFRNVHISAPP